MVLKTFILILSIFLFGACEKSSVPEVELEEILEKKKEQEPISDDFDYMSLVDKKEFSMLKLYKRKAKDMYYSEAWINDDIVFHHKGKIGTEGETFEREVDVNLSEEENIVKVLKPSIEAGYKDISEQRVLLLIEYKLTGSEIEKNLAKRHELQDWLNSKLGWTGLGRCDGGSIGSGTMEVSAFVINYEVAKKLLERELKGTKFANYTRIYKE